MAVSGAGAGRTHKLGLLGDLTKRSRRNLKPLKKVNVHKGLLGRLFHFRVFSRLSLEKVLGVFLLIIHSH